MSKKLKLVAAGALGALALAALPAIASAGEYEMHCPAAPCIGSIAGSTAQHPIELENDNGEKFDADALDGTIKISAATSTTATVELELTHFHEAFTGFNFTCNSPGAPSGVFRLGALTAHFVNLTDGGTNPGVLLTNFNITLTCAGFLTKTFTGGLIGTITTPNCNTASATNVVTFNKVAGVKGTQEHQQVTGTGPFFDLTAGPQSSDGTTTAFTAQLGITWQAGNKPTLTC